MSLGFILGKASRDHQKKMVEEIALLKKKDPQGQFFYLVPNHIKFASEIRALKMLRSMEQPGEPLFAETNVQVFSFTRLAWFFLKNTAFYQIPRLSKAGLNMVVQNILRMHQDELTVFKGEQTQLGFVSQLVSQLTELRNGCVSSTDLTEIATSLKKRGDTMVDLQAKIHDLQIIYQAFEQATLGKYNESADLLDEMSRYLAKQDLEHSYFFIAGFSQLTAGERRLVETLIQHARHVRIALVLDKPYSNRKPEIHDLFYKSGKLYFELYQRARETKVPILLDQYAEKTRIQNKSLLALEDYWIETTKMTPMKEMCIPDKDALQIFQASNRFVEVREVATRIRQLVVQGYHYRDFLIMTRHLDLYQNVLQPVFEQFNIPIFVDLQKKMTDHPLVELINALFAVKKRYYRYDDIMRLLKTELLIPQLNGRSMEVGAFRECLDLTENMILKYGFEGKKWLQKEDWTYYRFTDTDTGTQTDAEQAKTRKVNLIRHFVKEQIAPFFKKIDKAKNGLEAATLLCNFLIAQNVPQRLLGWRDAELAKGNIEAAARPEQTWETFCQLLDEYVLTLGEFEFNSENFLELLQSGFEGSEYSQVPSTLDQVIISESGMVQMNERKITFMIGSTDTVMPDSITQNSLLSDADRLKMEPLLQEGQYIAETADHQMAAEIYLNYLAFMSSSERLYLSYPCSSDDQIGIKPSRYLEHIQQHFSLKIKKVTAEPILSDEPRKSVDNFVGTMRTTLTQLLNISRQSHSKRVTLPVFWHYIYQLLQQNTSIRPLMRKLFESLDYKNIPEKLRPEIIDQLYGETINTSVSKMEEFYANQYAYFLKYGLRLQERDVFELSAANTGEFFHLALDSLMKAIAQTGKTIAETSQDEINQLLQKILLQIRALPQFQILSSSNRMNYLSRQLLATVRQIGWSIRQQAQRTAMRPLKTEVLFGHVGSQDGLRPLTFELPYGKKVNVRGKIDRIDHMDVAGKDYLGIVDYKSSSHVFDFRDAYYGLALQMLTYLNAVMKNLDLLATGTKPDEVKPAGALYMHLYNPKLKLKEVAKKTLDEVLLKKNKYDGILVADPMMLEQLDHRLNEEGNGESTVYPFRRNKDGSFKARKHQLVTYEELLLLLEHNEELIRQAATQIFAGENALNPALWPNGRSALQYSPFKSIFQFDALLPENNYHRLEGLSPLDILSTLKRQKGIKASDEKD
ncbi:ATP-dependent helicase deoxyribonuclease subunit B [Liquorilactobacillus aquaticus DSM 21051]|uniref:ATP-dependent helicase/deoxyribonuclease subunit B n=1 Tax=Liquorilactobacillus aquaticus DSM 21051 TaxID=1423725 RepID=A0A0R2CW33_9LACO|nr:PD-(D/E)XK nuclease family protein [Liquorilactobacillus aquaticus]KRM95530.1 ATP-dependent helicase deoxyribonuclease subunit B [Liquorilactobacillus aquaticus DSM 21051]